MNNEINVRGTLLALLFLLVVYIPASASDLDEFRSWTKNSTLENFKFSPIWGSHLGYREFDDKMKDLSDSALNSHDSLTQQWYEFLIGLDTTGWPIDDQIDYSLELSGIESYLPGIRDYFDMKGTTAYYSDECQYGIFLLATRCDRPLSERYKCLIGRLSEIPGYLARAESLLTEFNQTDLIFTIRVMQDTYELIGGFCDALADSFPQDNGKISTARDRAILATRDFISFCAERGPDAPRVIPLGEEKFIRKLRFDYQLNISPDSLMALADLEFWRADSLVKLAALKLPLESRDDESLPGMNDLIDRPSVDSIKLYCQDEVAAQIKFLEANEIIDIPDSLPKLEFVEIPGYLNHAGYYSDFFVDAGVLNPDQTGYFYSNLRMLNHFVGDNLPKNYIDPEFRDNIIRNVIPGRLYLTSIARKKASFTRQSIQNDMFTGGWYQYIKGVLIDRGLFGDDPKPVYDYYCDLRSLALGAYIDVGFNSGRLTLDSARTFVIERMGADSSTYRVNSAFNSYMPFQSTAPFMGRLIFIQMHENALKKEGDKFNLKDFHDKILSEGCIPPVLIAKKYGW
jgi:hypothetical protein